VETRYFATIEVGDRRSFDGLGSFGFDLVHGTSRRREDGGSVTGLLTMHEVATLVDRGYEVTVHEPEARRSRARDLVTFDEWIKGI